MGCKAGGSPALSRHPGRRPACNKTQAAFAFPAALSPGHLVCEQLQAAPLLFPLLSASCRQPAPARKGRQTAPQVRAALPARFCGRQEMPLQCRACLAHQPLLPASVIKRPLHQLGASLLTCRGEACSRCHPAACCLLAAPLSSGGRGDRGEGGCHGTRAQPAGLWPPGLPSCSSGRVWCGLWASGEPGGSVRAAAGMAVCRGEGISW